MTKKRILLVEDDNLLRMGLKSMIDMHGKYVVDDDVANGKDAVRSFRMKKQDIVLLDLRLPDMAGTEVLKKIREIEPDAKVVVLTASDDNDFIYEALEHGANAYVLKGSNPTNSSWPWPTPWKTISSSVRTWPRSSSRTTCW
jgi:DNA-binding NarL/FixJ family response regulator